MTVDWNQVIPNVLTGLIPNIVTGLASGGLSAWITYQLAFRRFRAEKWWERRADAYSGIVEALHNSLIFADTHINYMQKGSEVPPEKDAALRKAAQAGHDEILRAVNVGKLFLSSAALNRLTRFLEESENINAEMWSDYLEEDYGLTNTCLNEFAQLARDDLGTTR
jgi:hypothetical protein